MPAGSSALLLDETFEAGDDRFLGELLASAAGKKLKALADRWYGDARPFARRALLRYIDDGCDRPYHRGLVKTLFKLAELGEDDEAMAHFLVAFDRLVKRSASRVHVWDRKTRSSHDPKGVRVAPGRLLGELAAGRRIAKHQQVRVLREEPLPGGRRLYVFKAMETSAEAVVDADGAFKKAQCTCSFFQKSRLRAGPCRHLVALEIAVLDPGAPPPEAPMAAEIPADLPPRPVVSTVPRSPQRREEVVSFTGAVIEEIKARALAEDRGLFEIVEEAWDLAFERICAISSWKEALRLCDPARAKAIELRSVAGPEQQSLQLHVDVLREISLVAEKFGSSPSAVVNLAWLVARRKP